MPKTSTERVRKFRARQKQIQQQETQQKGARGGNRRGAGRPRGTKTNGDRCREYRQRIKEKRERFFQNNLLKVEMEPEYSYSLSSANNGRTAVTIKCEAVDVKEETEGDVTTNSELFDSVWVKKEIPDSNDSLEFNIKQEPTNDSLIYQTNASRGTRGGIRQGAGRPRGTKKTAKTTAERCREYRQRVKENRERLQNNLLKVKMESEFSNSLSSADNTITMITIKCEPDDVKEESSEDVTSDSNVFENVWIETQEVNSIEKAIPDSINILEVNVKQDPTDDSLIYQINANRGTRGGVRQGAGRPQGTKKPAKTTAERCREYRQRIKEKQRLIQNNSGDMRRGAGRPRGTKPAKTTAERCREYRQRIKEKQGLIQNNSGDMRRGPGRPKGTKKPEKTTAERCREYRQRIKEKRQRLTQNNLLKVEMEPDYSSSLSSANNGTAFVTIKYKPDAKDVTTNS